MTYCFSVRFKDGEPELFVSEGMAQHIPDGDFVINGHKDERNSSLSVSFHNKETGEAASAMSGRSLPAPPG